jgi:hypothetical protein
MGWEVCTLGDGNFIVECGVDLVANRCKNALCISQ